MLRNFNILIINFTLFSCADQNNQDLNLIFNNSLIIDGENHFNNISVQMVKI